MFLIKLKMCVSKQDFKEIITQMSVHHFGKFWGNDSGLDSGLSPAEFKPVYGGATACAKVPPAILENCPEME